jgi:formylglycine-generating enzyme required for sulfatase activity
MTRKHWLLALGILIALALVTAAILLLPRTPSPPHPVTPSPTPLVSPAPSPSLVPSETPTPIPATGSDDVEMVEVPAGEFLMGLTVDQSITLKHRWELQSHQSFEFFPFSGPVPQLTVYLDTFSIDQVEVTLGRYQACVDAGICSAIELSNYQRAVISETTQPANDYPVTVEWEDALLYCQWVGKRLPTEAEWEKAARGTDGRLFPWGDEWDANRVSQEWNPVGHHPQGASPYGALDMVGNAPEWTLDSYRRYPGSALPPPAPASARSKVTRGGHPFEWEAVVAVRDIGLPGFSNAGFRCVEGGDPVDLAEAVADYRPVVPTPAPTPTAVDLNGMVKIPAGKFTMGFDERLLSDEDRAEHLDETPQHEVYLDTYYIDRSPVTAAQYAEFLNVLGQHRWACGGHDCCAGVIETPDIPLQSFHRIIYENGRYHVVEGREEYPVDKVSWYGAQAYCAWRGKRLPTEAEWEKAARGTDGRRYPWGNEWDPRTKEDESWIFYAYPVGSKPFLASPYGVMDLIGNTQGEWVSDWYAPDYYAASPNRNPQGPSESEDKVRRGGLGIRAQWGVTFRFPLLPSSPNGAFRCVYVPSGNE